MTSAHRELLRSLAGPLQGLGATLALTGCTGQIPGIFSFNAAQQAFNAQIQVNTKIDLLWVVDNSSSMDVSQEKLRAGFAQFARKYLQPTWDVRVAVITTDTYLADSRYAGYLGQTLGGTASTIAQAIPSWNANHARLVPGQHDGPTAALCITQFPYFMYGSTACATRDAETAVSAADAITNCVNGTSTTSLYECVNTVANDTIHSGKPIISTMPPAGTAGDAAWIDQLVRDFMVNVSTSTSGHGSERGLQSVLQLLVDNEGSGTAFFRTGSLRGIIFVSDEDDQSQLSETVAMGQVLSPWKHYACDQAQLIADNGGGVTGAYCCSGGGCSYGAAGTACAPKVLAGGTYTVSVCPDPNWLMPVSDIKTKLNRFFWTLDGDPTGASLPNGANYFVTTITPLTYASVQTLQGARNLDDITVGSHVGGVYQTYATDRGDRYLQLGDLVGNGSLQMDIAQSDYSPILQAIGDTIIQKKGTFNLDRAPTSKNEVIVKVAHTDGTASVIDPANYAVAGKILTVTDLNLVLGLTSADQILVNYQPSSAY